LAVYDDKCDFYLPPVPVWTLHIWFLISIV
jgi:hypothetical protein